MFWCCLFFDEQKVQKNNIKSINFFKKTGTWVQTMNVIVFEKNIY